jgi:signal transduction histidine kinase
MIMVMIGRIRLWISAASVVSLAALSAVSWLSYRNTKELIAANQRLARAHKLIEDLAARHVLLDDAETSCRDYALSGRTESLKVQALVNLLGNAIKFSPRGGRIEFAAERTDRSVVFRVEDNGRGIPKDKLETIFERFQQVDASDAREKGGTGLGLAIVRSIVQQHSGRVWAESELGRGSKFYIQLPLLEIQPLSTE